MERLSIEERFGSASTEETPALRAKIEAARKHQIDRFQGTTIAFNAAIPGGHIEDHVRFAKPAFDHYLGIVNEHRLTTRSVDRIAKVSRTVADLEDSDEVQISHVDIAASYIIGGMLRENFQ